MQTITSGVYKNFKYTYFQLTRIITVYDLFDVNLDFNSLALLTIQRPNPTSNVSSGFTLYAPSLPLINSITYSIPQTLPTAAPPTAGGSVTIGTHSYAYSNVIGSSETLISSKSNVITATTTNKTVSITVPLGPVGTISRNIYRTNAGDTSGYYLVGSINNNTGTTFSDTTADNQTTLALTSSYAYDITYNSFMPTLKANDSIVIEVRNLDQTYDYNFNAQKVIPQVLTELPPSDSELSIISDSNLGIGTYYYELLVSNWRNLMCQIIASITNGNGTIKIYKTLDNTVAVTATNATPSSSWYDCTSEILGWGEYPLIAGVTASIYLNFSSNLTVNKDMPDRYMLMWKVTNSVNSIVVTTRKF